MDTRTAIVTGAPSGIGLALAQAYQSRHRRDYAHPALRLGGQFEFSFALPGARRRLAGGIADGRRLAAAFALGAEGVHTFRPLTMIFPALIERISDHDRKQSASRRSIWSSQ